MYKQEEIRNFCIIAHIDHGKSTLADRLLQRTGAIEERLLKSQHLDTMDIERERGITIKLQPVRMLYHEVELNLIDTPGHVDFTYEVSRSLAAVEGAILLVDATQGVQAQTLANLYLALEQNVEILPVINKIDLPNADVAGVSKEIQKLLGCRDEEILRASGKTGIGVEAILDRIIEIVPPPHGKEEYPLRALIFDSVFDEYRGVIIYIRVVDGSVVPGQKIRFAATSAETVVEELGALCPGLTPTKELTAGEIGYVVTGLKEVKLSRVGDTVITAAEPKTAALPGYREVRPMVYVGIFPEEGSEHQTLRDALERLSLNDAALQFEPEHSAALGFGFRVGFLGLLHLEVTQERLRREYNLELVVTSPSVAYRVYLRNGESLVVKSPHDLPRMETIERVEEPWVSLDIITPASHIGGIMPLVSSRRGEYNTTEYIGDRALLHYRLPLQSILVDFYDKLKSASSGYASMNYQLDGYETADVVRMDVLIAEEPAESLSTIVYRDELVERGRKITSHLKDVLPRQQFVLKIQASVGGKVVAAERLSALRKDVTAKLYGGDVTRKRKLLDKQKKGKQRMAEHGRGKVAIPPETFISILKR
ncbi:elongation factor 4 [Candidatus Uhrbacteria bacterium CG10_big_fil_rev_8_21_14_0_10_48_11]|uniref:Elongation factor 4 n=1 Tax=Candidatus Uhrbacteria bacterium CG10_big_fil_rev_8_21_14_0_10_48_11 TaxID=1975037 RepID=A0A2M8LFS5_9BACT|nr:MAG: elongation factor 4 [Candidatus Uhrbacteria bacterium CG10_big_fil_rev_8_21_14_0_10_48_11]